MDPLAPIREKIDRLDGQLVALLNERLALAAEIGRRKRASGGEIYVPAREDAVLRKVAALNAGPLRPEALQAIYREIMSAALALEKPRLAIAFMGPEASRTHAAATAKFGASVSYRSRATVGGVFATLERGEADYAVVPFERPPAAEARETCDRLAAGNFKIIARMEGATANGAARPAPAGPPARFFVLGREPSGRVGGGRDRSVYQVSPGEGGAPPTNADRGCLRPMAEGGIGIPTVESLPASPEGGAERYFVEVSRDHDDPELRAAWAGLEPTGLVAQWLGSYPVAG